MENKLFVGAVAGAAAAISSWIGDYRSAVIVLICSMGVDILLGVAIAIRVRKMVSKNFIDGCLRKAAQVVVVALSILMTKELEVFEGIASAVIMLFIGGELISVTENLSLMGVKMPKVLTRILASLTSEDAEDS